MSDWWLVAWQLNQGFIEACGMFLATEPEFPLESVR